MSLSFFLISLALSVPWPHADGNNTSNPPSFPPSPLYERLRSSLRDEIEAGQHVQKREAPDDNPDHFPSPLFYEAVYKTIHDKDHENVSANEEIARRMFTEDLRVDNYEDPHDGPSNSFRGFMEGKIMSVSKPIPPKGLLAGNFYSMFLSDPRAYIGPMAVLITKFSSRRRRHHRLRHQTSEAYQKIHSGTSQPFRRIATAL